MPTHPQAVHKRCLFMSNPYNLSYLVGCVVYFLRNPLFHFFLLTTISCLLACENDLGEVSKFVDDDEVAIEVGEEVKMLYSDSGKVEMMIEAPVFTSTFR